MDRGREWLNPVLLEFLVSKVFLAWQSRNEPEEHVLGDSPFFFKILDWKWCYGMSMAR